MFIFPVRPKFPDSFMKIPTQELLERYGDHDIMRGRCGPYVFADHIPFLFARMPGTCHCVKDGKEKFFLVQNDLGIKYKVYVTAEGEGAVVKFHLNGEFIGELKFHEQDYEKLIFHIWKHVRVEPDILELARADCFEYSIRALALVPWVAQQPKMMKIIEHYHRVNEENLPSVHGFTNEKLGPIQEDEEVDQVQEAIAKQNEEVENQCCYCFEDLDANVFFCRVLASRFHRRCAYEYMFTFSKCMCNDEACYEANKHLAEDFYLGF